MLTGIRSQYGFLYQKYVFIKTVLEKASPDRFFVFEGKDDIDVSEIERIISVKVSNETFIQVKSGTVYKECWAKVLGNWLLIDDNKAEYKVVLEKPLTFEADSDETLEYVCAYFVMVRINRKHPLRIRCIRS